MGLVGIWSAKLIAEVAILLSNTYLIESCNWEIQAENLAAKRKNEEEN